MLRRFVAKFFTVSVYLFIRLRYKFVIKGKEHLKDKKLLEKGVLICPNHPTVGLDPFIVQMFVGNRFDMIPLVGEDFFSVWVLKPFMWATRARPVLSFDNAVTDYKYKETEKLYNEVIEDLKNGEKVLLYPAGGLKHGPKERIGGRSLAYRVMQDAPDTEMLLVRMSGMWGSALSTAQSEGVTPSMVKLFGKAIWKCLLNGIFFAPRRKILVEFERPPENFPKHGKKLEFNRWLEDFYNSYPTQENLYSKEINDQDRVTEEPLIILPEYFWSKKLPKAKILKKEKHHYDDLYIPGQVRRNILFELSELSGKSVKEIKDEDELVYDIGLDSMDIASVYTYIDSHFDLDPDVQPKDLKTVKDLFLAAMHINKKKKKEEKEIPAGGWPHERRRRKNPEFAKGDTVIEAFLNSCDRMGAQAACADLASGVLDYHTMKRAAIILAEKIKKLDGEYIGVLLPSTAGTYIIQMAIYLAGKVPVPLNWTVGTYFMNHAINLVDLRNIISSKKFLKRLGSVDLGEAIEKIVAIEDIKSEITVLDKIKGVIRAKQSAKAIIKRCCPNLTGDDMCVMLFTSGSTALPKAVPLTHRNILSNQKAALKNMNLNSEDVLLKCLPPFHVFGWSLSLLPLFTGVRVYYSPDPLDGGTLAKMILKWKCTILMMAPTFLAHLFKVASIGQLKTLRLVISGAEKAQASLLDFISKLGHVKFIEGYGLTETAPILCCGSVFENSMIGVGKVIDSCEVIIMNTESCERMHDPHQVGEVLARGESVFGGYYKQDNRDVFISVDGKTYYRTGDLGYFDENGNLLLEGRLKLSFKRGGEMISSQAIETTLAECAREKNWIDKDQVAAALFAVVPKEKQGQSTRIVLFTSLNVTIEQINTALKEKGFARLYKINEIVKLKEMPIMKNGKICYRELFEKVKEGAAR
ncbi:MAG: Bifunctional protein Aas [Chlamydiia bacterium]|nr:Bifunctional protein Aas [Chlamydiia bacterium]